MPRGDKAAYTDKQKRQAEHVAQGYEDRGVPEKEAERRAWATENKISHGGRKSGSGRGKAEDRSPMVKGGHKGGAAVPPAKRMDVGGKAARTRKTRAK